MRSRRRRRLARADPRRQPPGLGAHRGGLRAAAIWERDGVLAAIVPAAPDALGLQLGLLRGRRARCSPRSTRSRAAYEEAGVRAWTVWVPEDDSRGRRGARGAPATSRRPAARHGRWRSPTCGEPEPDPELEIVERDDYAAMARLNEIAYGYPPGDFAAVAEATDARGLRIYFGAARRRGRSRRSRSGRTAPTPMVDLGRDAARGARPRHLRPAARPARSRDAREAGLETTTLQSTKLGRPGLHQARLPRLRRRPHVGAAPGLSGQVRAGMLRRVPAAPTPTSRSTRRSTRSPTRRPSARPSGRSPAPRRSCSGCSPRRSTPAAGSASRTRPRC